jgi:hypothetical protein
LEEKIMEDKETENFIKEYMNDHENKFPGSGGVSLLHIKTALALGGCSKRPYILGRILTNLIKSGEVVVSIPGLTNDNSVRFRLADLAIE